MIFSHLAAIVALGLPLITQGQLSGTVGPLTTYSAKAETKICNILDYGATSSLSKDSGAAIQDAMDDCVDGGLVWVPSGNYLMDTFITIKDCSKFAVQLDGILYRGGGTSAGDYMFSFRNCQDFEFFSGSSKGAIQGYGYEYLEDDTYGPRIFNFQQITDFSVHGFAVVDSPAYYFRFTENSNGEIYNIIVRGATTLGETDAFDVDGDNIWVHDIEVTNGDECVTLKANSTNFLVQSIYCNLSGGTAIGSLGNNVLVENILYERLYMNYADACYIKSNNGSGHVRNIVWDDVIVHNGAYPLTINSDYADNSNGGGIQINNLTFSNWKGTEVESARPVIRLDCPDTKPCYEITIESNVYLWTTDSADYVDYQCWNAYGSGACLTGGSETTKLTDYSTNVVKSTAPASYSAAIMSGDFTAALSPTTSFAIPTVPTSFFPSAPPSSKLLSLTTAGA